MRTMMAPTDVQDCKFQKLGERIIVLLDSCHDWIAYSSIIFLLCFLNIMVGVMNSIDKPWVQEINGLYVGDDLFEDYFHDHV